MDDSEVNTPTSENNKTTMPPPNHIPNEATIFNNLSEIDNSTLVSGSVSPQIMVDANQPYTPVHTPDTGLGGPSQSKSRRNLLINNPDQNNDNLETMSTNSGQTINSRKNHKNRPSSPDNETLNHILNQINCYDEPKRLKILQKIFNEMSHYSLSQVEGLLTPMLQRDFISMLPLHGVTNIAEEILTYLDAGSLSAAEQVSPAWKQVIMKGFLWKRLIERKIKEDTMWCGLAEREEDEWGKFFERAIQQAHAKNTRKNHPTYKSRRQKLAEKEARDKKDGKTAENSDKTDTKTSDKKDEISSSTPKTDNNPSSSTPLAANPLASAASANSLAGGDNNTLSRNNTGNSADVSNLPLSAQALIAQANSLDVQCVQNFGPTTLIW